MIERRKYARLNIEASVTYRIIGHKDKSKEPAECNNISPEGLGLIFQHNDNIKNGTKLEIVIGLKNSKPFTMIGEIIWVSGIEQKANKAGDKLKAGIKILEIYNDDENRFLLQLCDRMVQKLNKECPTIKS
ncbi:MAG: PilZ domain-containing protein [Candidatus Omnitrophica bacterium]|nr:PilZ domain-containing protein [Candidatus Omnitrophota bacterium]MBU4488866.1 PilZ domain-containing protein [Candidatus Omnitrophota bacterium]MCG2705664.1 PilZ domain-containing protein [Candidatus Omnitrophota bacterium]